MRRASFYQEAFAKELELNANELAIVVLADTVANLKLEIKQLNEELIKLAHAER